MEENALIRAEPESSPKESSIDSGLKALAPPQYRTGYWLAIEMVTAQVGIEHKFPSTTRWMTLLSHGALLKDKSSNTPWSLH